MRKYSRGRQQAYHTGRQGTDYTSNELVTKQQQRERDKNLFTMGSQERKTERER